MATLFVTGGTGFIGAELVRFAVAAGQRVQVLARSSASAARAEQLGTEAVLGDLAWPGEWQAIAARADGVLHIAQPLPFGQRVTQARAERWRAERLRMDRLLLDPLPSGMRVLYVGGTSYYGHVGATAVDEGTTPQPRWFGPFLRPAIELLERDLDRGLRLVQAFPGHVYGPGSWFGESILTPLRAGKRLTQLDGPLRTLSLVHVRDCARALLHLLERGEAGQRYFVVDDRPTHGRELARIAAAEQDLPLRVRRVPRWLCRLLLGPIVTDSLETDCALSNRRLKAIGFTCEFPTVESGIAEVVHSPGAQ